MFDHDDETSTGSYWPSVTDLFITLFIISIVMLGAVSFVLLPRNNIAALKSVQIAIGMDFVRVLEPTNRLRVELGLQPIQYLSAKQVIKDLTDTCDAAVDRIHKLKQNDPAGMAVKIGELKDKIKDLEKWISKLQELLKTAGPNDSAELRRRIDQLEKENKELKLDSPTVVIDERRKEFSFDSGSSIIKAEFSHALIAKDAENEAPFPRIAAEIIKRKDRVDTLEIIGHTDGVALATAGNLDLRLPEFLAGEPGGSRQLTAGSNNDLGLLRALALKEEWKRYAGSYEPLEHRAVLQRIILRCYSAGQTILPIPLANPSPRSFRRNDPSARRIEMRLTRLGNHGSGPESSTPKSSD